MVPVLQPVSKRHLHTEEHRWGNCTANFNDMICLPFNVPDKHHTFELGIVTRASNLSTPEADAGGLS